MLSVFFPRDDFKEFPRVRVWCHLRPRSFGDSVNSGQSVHSRTLVQSEPLDPVRKDGSDCG